MRKTVSSVRRLLRRKERRRDHLGKFQEPTFSTFGVVYSLDFVIELYSPTHDDISDEPKSGEGLVNFMSTS